MAVIGLCIVYIAKHFHWPFGVAIVSALVVNTFAFLVSRVIEDDRR
jgi:hypothetical protein